MHFRTDTRKYLTARLLSLLLLSLLLFSSGARAAELALTSSASYTTGLYWQYQESASTPVGQLPQTLSSVMLSRDWTQSTAEHLNFGFRRNAYWMKMSVVSTVQMRWYLWNHYSLLDTVALYQCPAGTINVSACTVSFGGDHLPFAARDIEHPNLIMPLDLDADTHYDLYLYVDTEGAYQLPIEILDGRTLQHQLLSDNLLRGGYYALLLVMGLYNLMLFFSIRDRTYLFYSAFVITFLFFHMNFEGSAFGYFWPEYPQLNTVMMPLSFAITQFFFSLFLPSLLNLKQYSRSSWIMYRIYTPLTILFMGFALFTPYYFAVSVQNLINAMVALYTLIIGIRLWRMGYTPARLFTIAWLTFIAGSISGNISSLGLLPGNSWILHGYQLGSILDVVLLSLALGERIKGLQRERDRNQQQLSDTQNDAIRFLKKYEDLYQNSLSGRFQLNGHGEITGCNPAFALMMGYDSSDALREARVHFDQFVKQPDKAIELWETLNSRQKIQGFRISMMPRRGQSLEGLLTIRREHSDPEQFWVGALTVITETHKRDLELRRLQINRDQSLRQLVMGISHEMNTPLGNIRLAGTHLSEQIQELTPSELQEQFSLGLTHINYNTERLADLNHLIQSSLAPDSPYRPESLLLRHWLKGWKQRAQERFGALDLEVICSPEHASWTGYAEALDKVLMELVDNSLFHNPEYAREPRQLFIRISIAVRDHVMSLQYQDNGRGINKADQERVFLPFYTTVRSKAKKKGLGLYEVHNLVTGQMEGSFEWPKVSQGFALTLLLPEMAPATAESGA